MKKGVKLEKIGGWLILFTIGLFLMTFIWLVISVFSLIALSSPGFETFDLTVFILSLLATIFGIASLILEFKRKKSFIKCLIFAVIINLILTIVVAVKFQSYANIASGVIGAIVWIGYFISSKRVKGTFKQ